MIDVIKVRNKGEGQEKAHDILKKIVDKKTLLALSGGTSVDYLKMLVKPADALPGAICVVDERFGKEFHPDSNEGLLKKAGIIEYCKKSNIKFYKILYGDEDMVAVACDYDTVIQRLFGEFPKRVGVMGVGANLHTAGIFPESNATFSGDLVVDEEVEDKFPKRITLTLTALAEFTNFIILMFGQEKKETLRILLDGGVNDMQKYPAIFYRKAAVQSYLITDISIK